MAKSWRKNEIKNEGEKRRVGFREEERRKMKKEEKIEKKWLEEETKKKKKMGGGWGEKCWVWVR